MQHVLAPLQCKKASGYSILIFEIFLFGRPPVLNAWGRGPVRSPLCVPDSTRGTGGKWGVTTLLKSVHTKILF